MELQDIYPHAPTVYLCNKMLTAKLTQLNYLGLNLCGKFFYVMASGGLYCSIYITIYSPKLNIFAYWTQLIEHRSHCTIDN